jgi:alpha-tubulin suppressor-like RCC1 family protein
MVFSVGSNEYGQLGVADSQLRVSSAPLLVDIFSEQGLKTLIVKCGGNHSACITEDGTLYTWGQGREGALGAGIRDNVFEPICP